MLTNLTPSSLHSFTPSLTLATTDKSSQLFAETLPWILLLLGVIVAGGVIIYLARRYVKRGQEMPDTGFTLHDLREMHKAGEISEEEFQRAKAHMIGRLAAGKPVKPDESPDTSPGGSTGNPAASDN